jgi:DNA-binding PadR family transcriptional regulator
MHHPENHFRDSHHRLHEALHGIGRQRGPGRPGFGPRGFMGGSGPDGRNFRTGRKLAAPDLQLVLLALLEERPSHGYELIKTLEERSGGFYSPSPGMVYPALTYLEEIGYATVEAEGAKKLYRITQDGTAHLDRHRSEAAATLAQLERIGQRMGDVRRAWSGDAGGGEPSEDEDFGSGELRQARHDLRRALHDKRRASPEEQRRIIDILRRAASEIQGRS